MDPVIRPARPGDVETLVRAYDWLFAAPGSQPSAWEPGRAAAALREAIEAPRSTVLVAEHDGDVAGFCTVYLDLRSVRFGDRAWVEDLAVHPERRSLGVGKALLDAAKDWAREHRASHLELDSSTARTDAHRFYLREQPSWQSMCFGWEL